MKKNLTILIIVLCSAILTFSQTPQAIKYQAVAKDNTGKLLSNTNVNFLISIIKDTQSGEVVYSETHNFTTNAYGLANLNIGLGTHVSGSFSSINWATGMYFIKVEIAIGFGVYQSMGISRLLSVPYALYAEKSGTPGPTGPAGVTGAKGDKGDKGDKGETGSQGPAGTGLTNKGNWATDSAYTYGDYVFDRSSLNSDIASMWICKLALTSSTRPYLDTDHWVEFQAPQGPTGPKGEQGIQGTKGDKGEIGVQGPKGDQGIQGIQGLKGDKGDKGEQGEQGIQGLKGDKGDKGEQGLQGIQGEQGPKGDKGDKGEQGEIGPTGPAGTADFNGTQNYIPLFTGTSSLGNSILYQNGSYIGLGTTEPWGKLNIKYSSNVDNPQLMLSEESSSFSRLTFNNSIPNAAWTIAALNSENYIDDRINFYNNRVGDLMTLTGDGKLGIGNPAPYAKLDIAGSIKIADGTQGTGKVLTSDVHGFASWQEPSNSFFSGDPFIVPKFNQAGNGIMNSSIYDNGNVGINASSPGAKLQINHTSSTSPHLLLYELENDFARMTFKCNMANGNTWTLAGKPAGLSKDARFNLFYSGIGANVLSISGEGNVFSVAPLGLMFDERTGPMVTKYFDLFTSGDYQGAGRWGMFLANSTLSFGIPAMGDKRMEFVTYNDNSTVNSTLLFINSNGNVGINTNSPSQKLDINGNLKLNGTFMPNNNPGTGAQVLYSMGENQPPTWSSPTTFAYFDSKIAERSTNAEVNLGQGVYASTFLDLSVQSELRTQAKVFVSGIVHFKTEEDAEYVVILKAYNNTGYYNETYFDGFVTEDEYLETKTFQKTFDFIPGTYTFEVWACKVGDVDLKAWFQPTRPGQLSTLVIYQ